MLTLPSKFSQKRNMCVGGEYICFYVKKITFQFIFISANVVTLVLVDSQKTFYNLKPYTNYTVYVRAYASVCGASEQSEPKTVTTLLQHLLK
jgi:hypothetical protein